MVPPIASVAATITVSNQPRSVSTVATYEIIEVSVSGALFDTLVSPGLAPGERDGGSEEDDGRDLAALTGE